MEVSPPNIKVRRAAVKLAYSRHPELDRNEPVPPDILDSAIDTIRQRNNAPSSDEENDVPWNSPASLAQNIARLNHKLNGLSIKLNAAIDNDLDGTAGPQDEIIEDLKARISRCEYTKGFFTAQLALTAGAPPPT